MRYREGNHSIAIRGVERNHSIAVGGSSKSDLSSIVFFNVQSISRSCWGCGSKFEGLLPDYVQKGTKAYIEEFKANYRGSESEKTDLIDLYKKYKGHMNK
ncbi:chaperone protein dnaJ 6-like isoform X2 [Cynara cardunculus var. scolymus]|uniref:chaperone protein dnaJ 6-like isoform X2 n=1 Tax=Cynara cardunculus var. scolymus TaxID=59895 RepID=UPI000D62AEE3|nr:chaperone protein dnaJ 6-like isoform X2 [Cynara cardunculus var. scolymus]